MSYILLESGTDCHTPKDLWDYLGPNADQTQIRPARVGQLQSAPVSWLWKWLLLALAWWSCLSRPSRLLQMDWRPPSHPPPPCLQIRAICHGSDPVASLQLDKILPPTPFPSITVSIGNMQKLGDAGVKGVDSDELRGWLLVKINQVCETWINAYSFFWYSKLNAFSLWIHVRMSHNMWQSARISLSHEHSV